MKSPALRVALRRRFDNRARYGGHYLGMMMASKITQSSVRVEFETSTGYSSIDDFPPTPGSKSLLDALDEIGRILTINGDADIARAALEAAIMRTALAIAA